LDNLKVDVIKRDLTTYLQDWDTVQTIYSNLGNYLCYESKSISVYFLSANTFYGLFSTESRI
jgi:hypothetical protein